MLSGIKTNTFHHSQFDDIQRLVDLKQEQGLTVSLAFPTMNEEATIGQEIEVIHKELFNKYSLLDEIVVIDSGSADRTVEIARNAGAQVHMSSECLPHLGDYPGKGENLWKSLYLLKGDLIVWVDADIKNIHPKFVYGILGPLLENRDVHFVKAFYDRPLIQPGEYQEHGGGRVTEILVRPLLACFFPDLANVYQPCSGECAGRREVLESLSFCSGYGIETGMLIDIYLKYGPEAIAQVNLDQRIHRNQPTQSLGRMGFEILHAFMSRLENSDKVVLTEKMFENFWQLECSEESISLTDKAVQLHQRPPMQTIADYRKIQNGSMA